MSKKVFVFYIFAFFTSFFTQYFLQKNNTSYQRILSPLAESVYEFATSHVRTHVAVENAVKQVLDTREGTYSIAFKNLKTNEQYTLNEHDSYDTASLYKLWIMAVVFDQIEKGTLKKSDVLTEDIATLNEKFDIASEEAELAEGEISMTVARALERMITVSDNYSALLLTAKVRLSTVRTFLEKYGFTESSVGTPPKATAADIALFYEKLYKKELVSESSSDEMMELLKAQQLNDRIPKYLPQDIEIAHKTGELGGYKHDAGIVFSPKGDYILVVLSDTNNQKYAAETAALVSKHIYEKL